MPRQMCSLNYSYIGFVIRFTGHACRTVYIITWSVIVDCIKPMRVPFFWLAHRGVGVLISNLYLLSPSQLLVAA